MYLIFYIFVIWLILLVIFIFWKYETINQRVIERLIIDNYKTLINNERVLSNIDKSKWIRFLWEAGYRTSFTRFIFLISTVICAIFGIVLTSFFNQAGTFNLLNELINDIPGGMGDIFLPLAWLVPFVLILGVTSIPVVIANRARYNRRQSIEKDLPLTLELLAVLCEAGLSFDMALEALIRSQIELQSLALEFRAFRIDTLSGRSRVQAFRRLGNRVSLPAFDSFISSMIQAEQAGAGIADVLRRQAAMLRSKKREHALEMAMSLPAKRMLPMAICFFPALFIVSLGPIFYEILQMLDTVLKTKRTF
jgi:pilus assembly protein TadC